MVTDADSPYISTAQEDIERIATKHFQTSTGIPPDNVFIPSDWLPDFAPQDNIDASIYQNLMNPVIDSEYLNIISNLPNNKASGPSSITYEAVQHAGPLCRSFIIRLLNACIHTTLIPNHWRHALLYPIPKPTDWECSINKTRPIVLLEIFRKVLSKILTLRLSTVFTQHCILQEGNFTELPGGSTFEPIHMINLIREDAIRNNKEV